MNRKIQQIEKIIATTRPEVLAAKLGVSCASIWNWKSGRHKPSPLVVQRFKEIFSVKF